MFPVLYSPNEPVYFQGFFTSWIRIQEANFYVDPEPKQWRQLQQKPRLWLRKTIVKNSEQATRCLPSV